MKGKEIKYAIAFDANKESKEIRMMAVYVFTQNEFKKLMESAMRCYTELVEANDGREEAEEIEKDGLE